jgi:HlyD family secretion protein
LFLIAKDLTRIQVWASVNEADIGNIHPGQNVTFTVDAYPKRVFAGLVNKVRLNATMTQNVVTYTVEVNTDNADGRLLPYLTANVNFLAGEATNALLVLNSALRWHPRNDLIAPEFRQPRNGAGGASEGARASRNPGAPAKGPGASSGGGRQGGERGGGGQEACPHKREYYGWRRETLSVPCR